jgi:pantetheine-phosphate adenylyltransferase
MIRRAIYPASLDPIHFGHIDIAIRALKMFDEVIVAIYDKPMKNILFTVEERVKLAREAFQDYDGIRVAKYNGLTVTCAREVGAMAIVRGLRVFGDFEFEFRMGLANKKLAPELETVAILADERFIHISSSTVREIAALQGDVSSMVPAHVWQALRMKFDIPASGSQ